MAAVTSVIISLIATTCPPSSDVCSVTEHSRYFSSGPTAQEFCENARQELALSALSSKSEDVRSMVFSCIVTPESARRGQLTVEATRSELGIGPARDQAHD